MTYRHFQPMANRNGIISPQVQTGCVVKRLQSKTDERPMPGRLKIYFDGGCRPTPGMIEVAVVIRGVAHISRDRGFGTSSDAEWLALIEACRMSLSLTDQPFVILGDCAPVINQANRTAKARGSGKQHLHTLLSIVGDSPPQIRYVKRSQNLAGIALQKLHPR